MQYSIKYRPLNFTKEGGWFGNQIIADEFRKRSINLDYPQAVLLKAQTGSGKCIAGNSLILTEKGFEKIQDYSENKNGFIDKNIKLLSKDNFVESSYFYEEEVNKTIKIKTKFGFEIEGTEEHPVYIFNGENFEFKKLKDIQENDIVIIKNNTQIFNKDFYKIDYIKKYYTNKEKIKTIISFNKIPKYVDKEIARLLGYIIANGYIVQRRLNGATYGVCSQNKNIIDDINNILKKLNVELKSKTKKLEEDCYILGAIEFGNFLTYLFDNEFSTAHYKKVPKCILQSPKEIQIEFLKALFDCDACINKKNFSMEYMTASKELAQAIQLMLLNLGILSVIKDKKAKGYNHIYKKILISSEDLHNLILLFNYKSKKYDYRDYENKIMKKFNTNIKVFWNLKKLLLQKIKKYRDLKLVKKSGHYYENGKTKVIFKISDCLTNSELTLNNTLKIRKKFFFNDKKYFKKELLILDKIIKNNYLFDKIIKKTILNEIKKVYDFTIPKLHNFYSNGIINHNTTAAKIISKTLNCQKLIKLESGEHIPCETCQPCKAINEETFINTNVTLFNGNVTSGKDDIQILEDAVYNSSIMSGNNNKVIIIEECHNLSNAAKERLLTLIEAPLKNVYFILITTEDFKLKLTNKSRCMPYHFNQLSASDLMDLGSYILKKENLFETVPDSFLFDIGEEKSVLQILAENSYGSPRQFLQYIERCIRSEIYTSVKIYESFKFDNIDENNIYEYLLRVMSKDKNVLNDIYRLNDIENFYYKCKTTLLEAGLYKFTGNIDDWKKSFANKLISTGQDIMLLLQIWNETKTYPFIDKSDFIIKLIKWFENEKQSLVRTVKRG